MRLHNLSGGLDSTLCLYLDLEAGRGDLLVHHVRLSDDRGREPHETAAVAAIRTWMHERYGPLDWVESAVGLGDIARPPFSDQTVVDTLTGMLLATRPDIDEVVVPSHLDAFPPQWRTTVNDAQQRRDTITRTVARRVPRWVRPIGHMTKADIVAALPSDLAALCWWCRTPDGGRPCHACLTCRQVDAVKGAT